MPEAAQVARGDTIFRGLATASGLMIIVSIVLIALFLLITGDPVAARRTTSTS